jgi:diguanylate cyclase (GGDEF)-like protein
VLLETQASPADTDNSWVSNPLDPIRLNKRLMTYTAAGMYGCAALTSAVEGLIPGGPRFSPLPGLVSVVLGALILGAGSRVPRGALAFLGPLGVGVVAYALATTHGAGDAAVLYMWPVLWTAFFFGRKGALSIVACVGVAQGLALLALPAADGYFDRWVDVTVSVSVVAAVVLVLTSRNDELLARLADEARTDPLTSLLNRRGFDEHATVELAHARREAHSVAVASIDIDHFKHVNDEWGHDIGDKVLARLGAILAAQSREVDVVARVGGEEFVVLMPGCNASDAGAFTDRVRRSLAAADDSGLPTVRVSAGVTAETAPDNVATLLRRADAALYEAKRTGRNRTVITAPDETRLLRALP